MIEAIVVLNAGSSSFKFALFDPQGLQVLANGQISALNVPDLSRFEVSMDGHRQQLEIPQVTNHQQALQYILRWIEQSPKQWKLVAAGHRVVHGGREFMQPVRIDARTIKALSALESLAPQHQSRNMAAIRTIAQQMPQLPQVACFDTAFHAGRPEVQRILPLPQTLRDKGLMKYGFHGLSYEYLVAELPNFNQGRLPPKLVIAHLGNGASACAISQGKSVATSMGFSSLDGLLMGSRCGAIDAGVLLHLLQAEGMSVKALSHCLYEQSGLLGLSGESADLRVLQASASPQASLAVEAYIDSILKHILALASTLQGLDALVFSGGVGENSAFIRKQVISRLSWLGCKLDEDANQQNAHLISLPDSSIQVFVIPANEEVMIARHTRKLI